jgi:hypothetical protein
VGGGARAAVGSIGGQAIAGGLHAIDDGGGLCQLPPGTGVAPGGEAPAGAGPEAPATRQAADLGITPVQLERCSKPRTRG